MVLCVPPLTARRTTKTLLPLLSALMMRYVGQGQEVGSSTSQPNSESMRMGGHVSTRPLPPLKLNCVLPQVLVTASRALLLAHWAWREGSVIRLWKAIHTAPVATMAFDPTSTLLATGMAPAGWVSQLAGTWAGSFGHTSPSPLTHFHRRL